MNSYNSLICAHFHRFFKKKKVDFLNIHQSPDWKLRKIELYIEMVPRFRSGTPINFLSHETT